MKLTNTPSILGYSLPAEWARHEATWLAWPKFEIDWPGKIPTVEWAYGEIVRKLAAGEAIRILVDSAATEKHARSLLVSATVDLEKVDFIQGEKLTGDGRPQTLYSLTTIGREAFVAYIAVLEKILGLGK